MTLILLLISYFYSRIVFTAGNLWSFYDFIWKQFRCLLNKFRGSDCSICSRCNNWSAGVPRHPQSSATYRPTKTNGCSTIIYNIIFVETRITLNTCVLQCYYYYVRDKEVFRGSLTRGRWRRLDAQIIINRVYYKIPVSSLPSLSATHE
jgi:hypothetical protein